MIDIVASGVLFDMDGTLVDSTAVVEATWTRFGHANGIDPDEILAFSHGRQAIDTLRRFLPDLPLAEQQRIAAELVAAGTVRDEGYGPMVLHDADVAWRRAHGKPDHPVFAIVTGSLSLDPGSRVFTEAPVRPIVLTSATAAASSKAQTLAEVADVVPCSADDEPDSVDAGRIRGVLADRGLGMIHCEGGPSFLGALIAADAVDELTLTLDPSLEGGAGPRIARGSSPELRRMRPAHVLLGADGVLLTRYVRAR